MTAINDKATYSSKYHQINTFPKEVFSNTDLTKHLKAENADIILVGTIADAPIVDTLLQTRKSTLSKGKIWYLLEYEHFIEDFNYQVKLNTYQKYDLVNRLDVVYPRNQNENIFVHSRLWAKATVIFEWLEGGAYVYEGSLKFSVEETLINIVKREANISSKEATDYVESLKKQGRFVKML